MEKFDPIPHLDSLVVAYINRRRAKIITRHPRVIDAICGRFVVYRRVSTVRDGRMNYGVQQEDCYALRKRKNYVEFHCFSALALKLVDICKELGVRLYVVDVPTGKQIDNPMSLPALKFYDEEKILPLLRDWQERAVRIMQCTRFGRYKVSTGGGKSFLIAALCTLAKDSTFLITVDSIPDLSNLYYSVLARGNDVQLIHGAKVEKPTSRIVCCSLGSLQRVSHKKYDILIGDEIHTQASATGHENLSYVHSERSFGFSANQDDRRDKADLWVEAIYGPVVMERTYEENVQAKDVVPIKVRFVDSYSVRGCTSSSHAIRERQLLVRNSLRNKQIAKLAKYYLERGHQVLILTRTSEHCLWISKELPEAVTVFKTPTPARMKDFVQLGLVGPDEKIGLGQKQLEKIQSSFAERKTRCVVANSIWHKGKDFPALDVLIRADAQATEIANTQLSGRLSRIAEGKSHGLLVDFWDNFDKALNRRAKARRSFYKKQGWEIVEDHSKTKDAV